MANDLNTSQAGIEGSCPRCMADLIPQRGWIGLTDLMDAMEAGDCTVYRCYQCGHVEDAVIRANRLAQHMAVNVGVTA